MTIRSRWWRVFVYLVAAFFAAGAVGLLLGAGSYNRRLMPTAQHVGSGLYDPTEPLGSRANHYTLDQARAHIPAGRFILPDASLASNDSIHGIWYLGGKDFETYVEYTTGIVITESPISIGTGSSTDVASFAGSFLSDGGGAKGTVTSIDGHDAFVAYATDTSGAEGPGSILLEVGSTQVSVMGLKSTVSMNDLYDVTSAVIRAGGG